MRQRGSSGFQVFGGLLTQEAFQPYLHYAMSSGGSLTETPIGAVLYSRKLSPTLQLHSLNVVSDQFTAVESLGWKPNKSWQFAVAGGKGSGDPYAAVEEHWKHNGWLDLRSSYTLAGRNFHRQEGPYSSVEPVGGNARLILSPFENLRLGVAHEHTLTYLASIPPEPAVQSPFNSGYFSASVKGFRLNTSMTTGKATTAKGNTTTELITLTRKITPRWTTFLADVNMRMPYGASQALMNINEYRLNPRITIRQNFSRMNGQNTYSFGGEWRSNRLSFSVDQQMYMSPLAASIGGKGLFQAWTFSVHLRTPRGTNANLDTFVDPMGHMQWGGYLGGLRYSSVSTPTDQAPVFPKYLISGKVVDDTGTGVWGVAVVVGKETLVSDSDGNFQLRVKTAKPLPFAVAPESSIQPGQWSLISAPTSVQGNLEDTAPVRVEIKPVTRLVAQR